MPLSEPAARLVDDRWREIVPVPEEYSDASCASLTAIEAVHGLHSGDVSGMVPSTFRIARMLLSRIEDERTGEVLLDATTVEIPADRVVQAEQTAAEIGRIADRYPFVDGAGPTTDDPTEQLLARTWRPALSVVGADGLPPTARAGNVLLPSTTLKLSLRVPPTADARAALAELVATLSADPPYGARATVGGLECGPGWNAPPIAPWLEQALRRGIDACVRATCAPLRRGRFDPVHGHARNAVPRRAVRDHRRVGPGRERPRPERVLHIPTARKLTLAVADLLDAHARR